MIDTAPIPARPITPVSILAARLDSLRQRSDLPAEIGAEVGSLWHLAADLDPYVADCTTAESEVLSKLAYRTAREDWGDRFGSGLTVKQLEQEMLSGHVEGQMLKLFVAMSGAKRVLDIGMFTGYSALAMAEGLPEDGQLIACEIDPYAAEFGQHAFAESVHGRKIHVEVGPALPTMRALAAAGEQFDFAFIDADKKQYRDYFDLLMDGLLSPTGTICVDNTFFQGEAYAAPELRSENGEALAQFNQEIANDERVEQVLLPIRDGVTLIRRKST
ncbi:MAG: class I SAM-dependent methyltransferase [Cyanobacteria bacterium P01_D01_bin.123]